jgi:hypothetical protein
MQSLPRLPKIRRPEAAVTAVDANMLRRVRDSSVPRTVVCLEMDGGRFKHFATKRCPWFDHLIACAFGGDVYLEN